MKVRSFARVGYDLMVDYGRPPAVPLKACQKDWAAEILRAKGLLK